VGAVGRRIVGVALLSLPFAVFTAAMAADVGWLGALLVWAIVAAVFGCMIAGVELLTR